MSDDLSSGAPPELQAGRDLEGQRILDRLRSRMFGVDTGPTRIGRWQLLQKLGKGAMGTVYAAYDPELDRRVAVKVLHGMDPDAEQARRLRLRREAQAMARVRHPNIVQVFDVCVDASQPYVVMELIEGDTLRTWQERPQRRWRELLAAYLDAARGLAALHTAGVFHRDFKPDNALREPGGCVRVVDFGLVSATPSPEESPEPRPGALTREGALIGTLAYMSPEQLAGGRGGGPSDQFSLCCSLFEAIYRVRPFVGRDPEGLLADIRDPVSRPGNPLGAPRRLFAQLRRGLAYQPQHRFASMSALADALARCLAARPVRTASILGGALALGVGAGLLTCERRPCDDVDKQLVGAWDPRQRAAIRDVFLAQKLPDADEQWASLDASMQRTRDQWIELRRETCTARRPYRAPLWAVQQDRCLDELRSIVQHLALTYQSPTPTDIAAARQAAAAVEQRLHDCAHIDAQHLAPAAPETASQLNAAIDQADAEQYAGRLRRAEQAARRALDIAERSGVPAASAAAHLSLGRVLSHLRRPAEALAMLDDAAREGVRAGHDVVHINALLFAAKTRILDLGALETATRNADDALDFIIRLDTSGVDTTPQTAELHEVRGFLAEKAKDLTGALDHFAGALRLHRQRGGPPSPLRLLCSAPGVDIDISRDAGLDELRTLHNMTRILDDLGTDEHTPCVATLYRELLAASESRFGPLSPLSLDIRFNYADHLYDAGRDREVLEVLGPSTEINSVQYGDRSIAVADSLIMLGGLALEAGDLQTAGRWSRMSAEILAEACVPGEGCPVNYGGALTLRGQHAMASGDPAQAAGFFRAAIEVITPLEEGQEQLNDATMQLNEALAELAGRQDASDPRARR